MANGTTVKDCEFKKECKEVYGPKECIFSDKEHCRYLRYFAILVRNATIADVIAISEETVKHLQWKMFQQRRKNLEALKMEVE